MITLMEMLKDEKIDPAAGRPLDITRIYMANVMSIGEAVLLAKKQKLAEARARRKQKADLYKDIADLARGKEPRQRCANTGGAAGPAGDGVSAARGRKRGRRGSPRGKEHLILLR